MAATPEVLVPHEPGKNDAPPAPGRKPWHTPRFIVSEVAADTQFSSNPPTNDNPYSQIS